jgi:hypothetical protein
LSRLIYSSLQNTSDLNQKKMLIYGKEEGIDDNAEFFNIEKVIRC